MLGRVMDPIGAVRYQGLAKAALGLKKKGKNGATRVQRRPAPEKELLPTLGLGGIWPLSDLQC